MSDKTSSNLSGFTLLGNPQWTFSSGVTPSTATFEVSNQDAVLIMNGFAGKIPVELHIIPSGPSAIGELKVSSLVVVDTVPTGTPLTTGVVVADRRWFWPKRHVLRRYNVRRKTGNMRLLTEDAMGGVGASVEDVGFAKWSLKNGTSEWKASQILVDVYKRIDPSGKLSVLANALAWDNIQISDLELDDAGDAALARVLGYMNGMDLFVDKDSVTRVYSKLDGSESVLFKMTGPPSVGGGFPINVDHRVQRPSKIVVYFNREIECRFDYLDGTGTTTTANLGVDLLDNVLPSQDLSLDVGGRTVMMGTWITIQEALDAWAATTPVGRERLSVDVLRENWYGDFMNYYAFDGGMIHNAVWASRLAVLKQHFRRTYRIPREWMDRIYQVKARRVAVWDEETGGMAPSPTWMDYTLIFDRGRPMMVSGVGANLKSHTVYDLSVEGYAQRFTAGSSAPVVLSIVDPDEGVISISFRGDPGQVYVELVPGVFSTVVFKDPTAFNLPRFRNEIVNVAGDVTATLRERFGMATVVTVALGAPNDESQLQAIEITAQQAEAKIRDSHFMPALGPAQDLRIGPSIMTARFAWQDSAGMAAKVRSAMGFNATDGATVARGMELVNQWINKKDCEDVALAFAAAYYAGLQDRIAGTKTTGLNPTLEPFGASDAVVHRVNSDGSATSVVSSSPYISTRVDPFSLLPGSVRRTIRREVFQNT